MRTGGAIAVLVLAGCGSGATITKTVTVATTTTAASQPTTTATPATTTTTAASINQAILASKYNAAYDELMRTIRQSARSADPSDQTAVAGVYDGACQAR
jgi:methylmalonyl-CoA mutase cobalamin-binding subunit